jgi:apolipoprotein N-acyltransferase
MATQTELALDKTKVESRAMKDAVVAVLAVAASSVLLFWGTGLHPVWFLTWLAPLPVLLISPRLGRWSSFLAAALAWFLGSLNMWHYLLAAIDLPLPIVLAASAVPACLFGLAALLFRRFLVRGSLWKAALVFPTFWVTCQYVNNLASPHGTFSNIGYSQMDLLPLLQLTSVAGASLSACSCCRQRSPLS